MPFFSKRKSASRKGEKSNGINSSATSDVPSVSSAATSVKPPKSALHSSASSASNQGKSKEHHKLVFHCQLAHGSPTGRISGFDSVKELYQKIAAYFDIPTSTIIFCTLNTHKIDMDKLLGGQIGLDDLIFAHVKGQPKEIEVVKSEAALGLTITDNSAGYAFIKRVKEESVVGRMRGLVKAGDHFEKINDQSVVGLRHFEVAKILTDIRVGSKFTIRLVEPNSFDFPLELNKRNQKKSSDLKCGTKTLRFKTDGHITIEEVSNVMIKTIDRINGLLETYMGINDTDLSQQIWDLAQNKNNPSDFATAIDESDLGTFNFTDEFIFDLWAAIGDITAGRVPAEESLSERL